MSTMKFNRKPPLPKSPIRLRSRRRLHPNSVSLQTPPGSLMKSAKPSRGLATDVNSGAELRPEYRYMSCELSDLAKQVRDELGGNGDLAAKPKAGESLSANSSPLFFERGKLYEEYAARRNERLRKKKMGGGMGDDLAKTPSYRLGVTVESSKRRDSTRKMQSLRKSVASAYGGDQRLTGGETPRYLLRSMCKDSKKPPPQAPLVPAMSFERSALPIERKIGVRSSIRRI